MTTHQSAYAHHRDTAGMTVAEYERAHRLPPFSVFPQARHARGPEMDGWAMYDPDERTKALAEEDRQMVCLRALGMTLKEVAALYGCHLERVRRRVAAAIRFAQTPDSVLDLDPRG